MFRTLWQDESGSVGTAELVLILTIMTFGVLVGMKSFRDAAVTEFADLAQALSNLDQSYSFAGTEIAWGGSTLTTAGFWYADQLDFCDNEELTSPTAVERCINLGFAPAGEGYFSP